MTAPMARLALEALGSFLSHISLMLLSKTGVVEELPGKIAQHVLPVPR
jgi:hypothetical protein